MACCIGSSAHWALAGQEEVSYSWYIENIEAAVAEEIERRILANLVTFVELYLAHFTASVHMISEDKKLRKSHLLKIRLEHWRILLPRKAWQKSVLEPRPNNNLSTFRKPSRITRMVLHISGHKPSSIPTLPTTTKQAYPVPMTPNNPIHSPHILPALPQNLIHALLHPQSRNPLFNRRLRCRSKVPPIFPTPEIEQDCFLKGVVLDEEGEGGHVHGLVAFLNGLHKGPGGGHDVGGGVYNGDGDGGGGRGEGEGRVGFGGDV